jgi:universal stress protein A
MYRNILLLMDCSPVDNAVLKHIAELAEIHDSNVHLFHVIHAHTLDQRRALEQKADECLHLALEVFERIGVTAYQSTAEGEPVEQILQRLSQEEYDLIALATHGHGRVSAAILGSVSRALKSSIDKPILMIRGEQ